MEFDTGSVDLKFRCHTDILWHGTTVTCEYHQNCLPLHAVSRHTTPYIRPSWALSSSLVSLVCLSLSNDKR